MLGLEGDFDGASVHNFGSTWGAGLGPYSVETYNNWRASIRGRIGYARGHALLYATVGAAWANFQNLHNFASIPNPNSNFPFPPVLPSDESAYTPVGWTVGAGLEYAVMGNLSARVEYRYSDFGSLRINSWAPTVTYTDKASDHTLRVGLSYRFWAPPPVLVVPGVDAKY